MSPIKKSETETTPEPPAEPKAKTKGKAGGMAERDHAEGCPAERIEKYEAQAPDGSTVGVTHCLDCGGMSYDKA